VVASEHPGQVDAWEHPDQVVAWVHPGQVDASEHPGQVDASEHPGRVDPLAFVLSFFFLLSTYSAPTEHSRVEWKMRIIRI